MLRSGAQSHIGYLNMFGSETRRVSSNLRRLWKESGTTGSRGTQHVDASRGDPGELIVTRFLF